MNYMILKNTLKIIKSAPTCFGSRRNHHQGAEVCVELKLQVWFDSICLYVHCQCYGGIRICISRHSTGNAHINKHSGTIPVILARHRLRVPNDGSCVNRNTSEQIL
jgi:hypothetical protein